MSESLAIKWRPEAFAELVGQPINAVILGRMVEEKKVPSGLLFSGSTGTGKTTSARVLASALTGSSREDIDAGRVLSVVELDAASNGSVAAVRELISTLRYDTGGEHRVVILDEAQSLTREAFNALLSTLEQPPAGTVFILTTTAPEQIPDTIKTRLREFTFTKVAPAEIRRRLQEIVAQEQLTLQPELLDYLADHADGSVRSAIMTLEKVADARIEYLDEYVRLMGLTDAAPALFRAMLSGSEADVFQEMDEQLRLTSDSSRISNSLVDLVRDLLILRAGGTISSSGAALTERTELAQRLDPQQLRVIVHILWELKTKVRSSESARENLTLSLIMITEFLSRGRPQVPPTPPPAPAPVIVKQAPAEPEPKLSFSDLQRL